MSNLKEHYNRLAPNRKEWLSRNQFFHAEILRYCRFVIPENSSVLELGCDTGYLLAGLKPSYGVGVDISPEMLTIAREKYPHLKFFSADVEDFEIKEKFDYVVITGTLGSVRNIQSFLKKISSMMTNDTRVIITYYNGYWGPLLRFAERIKWKLPEIAEKIREEDKKLGF